MGVQSRFSWRLTLVLTLCSFVVQACRWRSISRLEEQNARRSVKCPHRGILSDRNCSAQRRVVIHDTVASDAGITRGVFAGIVEEKRNSDHELSCRVLGFLRKTASPFSVVNRLCDRDFGGENALQMNLMDNLSVKTANK